VNGQVHARSRNIADFFDIRLADLAPGRALTFNVYLYFPHNRHLILWMKEGDVPSAAYVEGCEAKGIERLWVRNEDRDAYLLSIAPEAGAQPEPPGPVPRTPESAIIASAMTSSDLGREEKKAIVAETSRRILAAIAAPKLASSQETANERARRIVQETLEQTTRLATGAVREIWRLSDVDPDLVHAANVATFAVVFAMAFGRIDAEVIADLIWAVIIELRADPLPRALSLPFYPAEKGSRRDKTLALKLAEKLAGKQLFGEGSTNGHDLLLFKGLEVVLDLRPIVERDRLLRQGFLHEFSVL